MNVQEKNNKYYELARELNDFIYKYDFYRFDVVFEKNGNFTNLIYLMLLMKYTCWIERYLKEMIDISYFEFPVATYLLSEIKNIKT